MVEVLLLAEAHSSSPRRLPVVDPEADQWSSALHSQTPEHDRLMTEWECRTEGGPIY